jgi:5-formyltetrahydrofolate cyclo-ligase
MKTKAELRKALIEQRLNMPDRVQRDAALQQLLRVWLIKRDDTVIAGYWPIKGEFDALPALHRWQEASLVDPQMQPRRVALPTIDRETKTLSFRHWWPGCPMEHDAYDIPKPKDTEQLTPTLVLVPCVGYGPGGVRLGYGGGYFDRTLAALSPRPFTLGLAYAFSALADLDAEPHDIALDAILTDKGLVWPLELPS